MHLWRSVMFSLILVAIQILLFAACSKQEASTQPIQTLQVIVPGEGTENCRLGNSLTETELPFGKQKQKLNGHASAKNEGVEVIIENGKIDTIFYFFRSKTYRSFSGSTEKGIGANSTIDEVIKAYGKPDRIGESTVSEFGPEPGAKEHFLEYPKLGIYFTFYNEKLADIRIRPKKIS